MSRRWFRFARFMSWTVAIQMILQPILLICSGSKLVLAKAETVDYTGNQVPPGIAEALDPLSMLDLPTGMEYAGLESLPGVSSSAEEQPYDEAWFSEAILNLWQDNSTPEPTPDLDDQSSDSDKAETPPTSTSTATEPPTPIDPPPTATDVPTDTPQATEPPTITPEPSATPSPTDTEAPPPTGTSETETPTATPSPSTTPDSTTTPTPTPTNTPTPTATPSPTPTQTPTATEEALEDSVFDQIDPAAVAQDSKNAPELVGENLVAEQPAYRATFDEQGLHFVGLDDAGKALSVELVVWLDSLKQGSLEFLLPVQELPAELTQENPASSDSQNPEIADEDINATPEPAISTNNGWLVQENVLARPRGEDVYEIIATHPTNVQLAYLLEELPADGVSGDLELIFAFEGDFEVHHTADGILLLDDQRRGVKVSNTVAIDDKGNKIPLQMRPEVDQFTVIVPADWLKTAAFPVLIDPTVVRWEHTADSEYEADIAYDTVNDRALMVYTHEDGGYYETHGHLVDAQTGALVDSNNDPIILEADADQSNPVVAFNPEGASLAPEYLVAMIDWNVNSGDLVAQRLDAAGNLLDSKFTVAATDSSPWYLDMAIDTASGKSLLVWEQTASPNDYDIWGVIINEDGTVGTRIQITNLSDDQRYPDVTFDATLGEFLVTWTDQADDYVWVTRIDLAGNSAGTVQVSAAGSEDEYSQIAYSEDAGETLVTWKSLDGSHYDLYGRRLLNGALTGNTFVLADDQAIWTAVYGHDLAADPGGGGWMSTWWGYRDDTETSDILMAQIPANAGATSGEDLTASTIVVSAEDDAEEEYTDIVVRSDGGALVTFEDWGEYWDDSTMVLVVDAGDFGSGTPPTETPTPTPTDTTPAPLPGSITVCKIVVDQNGDVVDGSALTGSTFTLPGLTPTQTSGDPPVGQIGDSTFTTPLTFTADLLYSDGIQDAECVTYDNLELGSYYYDQETTSGEPWAAPRYNDGFTDPIASLDDFYVYDSNLFDGDPSNDENRNKDSDGHILLKTEVPARTLVVLNQYSEEPTPTPTLPAGYTCFDWRQADDYGWVDSTDTSSGASVIWDTDGMHGDATSGTVEVSAYFEMPTGSSWSILFEDNGLGSYTLAQGSAAPTVGSPLTEVLTPTTSGDFTVTESFIQLQWSLDAPFDVLDDTAFYSFCYTDIQVTSTPEPNQQPVVNAGPDQSITLPTDTVTLDSTVTDDGLPSGTLDLTWSLVSGPASVQFSDIHTEDPDVTFSEPGVYVLRLVADDGDYAISDEITITVSAIADLIVQQVDTSSLVIDSQTLEASGSVSADITNQGDGAVYSSFTITFFEDLNDNGTYESGTDQLLGTAQRSSLSASATVTVSTEVSDSMLFPGNLVYAFVDSGEVVEETDETNNYNNSGAVCEIPPAGDFNPVLEWEWTDSTVLPGYNQVMMAPVVADINEDGIPDIIFSSYINGNFFTDGHLRAISGDGSGEIFTVTDPQYNLEGGGSLAVGDIDGDGHLEIVAVSEINGVIIAFEHDGSFKWQSPGLPYYDPNYGGVAIADLDGDGIPEVIANATVLNSNDGSIRWTGTYGQAFNDSSGTLPLVADLDMDGSPEVVAGNTAYHYDSSLYWYNSNLWDGWNAIGDFDTDPFPEIVLVTGGQVYLLEHDGTLKWGPTPIPSGWVGGPPTVADVDGDGEPEIGVAGGNDYAVFETDGTLKWSQPTTDWSSQVTGSTVFDFEGDGQAEIVYRDEQHLFIYKGTDGTVLWSTDVTSITGLEYPLVADVDADGNAEIIVSSDDDYHSDPSVTPSHGIQVFGDADDNWVATRQIWNQHTYHITNVNDDGSIPSQEANNWEIYNNYRQNIYTGGACASAKPDLTASFLRKEEVGSDVTLTARIGNGGGIFVAAGVYVSFYDGDPDNGGTLLGTVQTTTRLDPGQYEDVSLTLPLSTIALPVWVVADDQGGLNGLHTELDEVNNIYQSRVYLAGSTNQPPVVDAGSDQTITLLTEDQVSLAGTASDDGLPIAQLTTNWSAVDGPAAVVIDDQTALATTVTFTEAGTYTLRLTADDAELQTSDDLIVIVEGPPTPPSPTSPEAPEMQIPGFIFSPDNQSRLSEPTPIVLADNTPLTDVTVDYWPVNDPDSYQTLASIAQVTGGETLATLDTTMLANGSYVIRVTGTDATEELVASAIMVTVEGEYKPGRVRFTVTDMTIPLVGLPITIGRTYDSLERDEVGDFGYGWSLAIANPKLEIDEAQNVTITMPDGRRSTFYFTPQVPSALFGFLMTPHYTPEPGVYGSLESNGCGLLTISSGIYACFPGPIYSQSVTGFVYTDPYGRKFEIAATGELLSITDLNDNVLTFTPNGITSTTGMVVPFIRDNEGRIVQIEDPEGNVFQYGYDADGNLDTVTLPDTDDPIQYDYYEGHFFKSATDPRGNQAVLTTYRPDNRLESVTDAEGNTTSYMYDVDNRVTYVTYPDTGMATFIYDEHGYLQTYTNPLNESTLYTYDDNHNLLTVTNPESETITYIYNEDGHRTHVYDPDSNLLIEAVYNEYGGPITLTTYIDGTPTTRTIEYDPVTFMPLTASDDLTEDSGNLGSYTWDSNGSPLTFTNAEDEVTTYTYDDFGNVLTETNPLTQVTEYTYDTFGRMLTREDPLERFTTYTYDALGRVETVTDVEGGVIEYQYDANGNVEVMIDQVGNRTEYEYDANNRLTKIINPVDNSFSEFAYDFRGNLAWERDPDGFKTCYEYDLAGQLEYVKTACDTTAETTTQYEYDAAGRVTDVTDPTGVVTTYDYDDMGRVTEVTVAAGTTDEVTTSYTYDTIGQLISMTDGNDNTTTYDYDIRGRRYQTNYPDGSSIVQEYDGVGRLLVYHDELGIKTSYTYDDLGRLTDTAVVSADDSTTVSTTHTDYDEVGRRTETIDANGLHTCYEYDDDNADTERTVTVTAVCDQPGSEVVIAQYVYDLAGQLLSYADANGYTAGYVTSYTYNEHGQLIRTDYEDSTYTTQEYLPSGRLHWSYDQDGVQTIYSYDTVGRLDLVQVISADGQVELSHTEYDYDDAGRRERVTQKLNALEDTETFYTYDLAGRLATVTEADGVFDLTTTYTYDEAGQLETVTDVRGNTTTYEYNERGWQVRTILPEVATVTVDIEQEYNDAGQIIHSWDENGYETTYTYDNVGRLQTVTNPESEQVIYGYNTAGQVTAITDAESHQTAFTYDIFGRLETKTWADGVTVETFGYDDVGNLTSHQWADGVDTEANTFVYNDMNRLSEAHYFDGLDITLTYTDSGQVETVALDGATPTTYAYNGLGLPTSVTHPNGDVIAYDYDDAGRRTLMTLPDTTTIAYTYDAANRLTDITNSTLPGAISFEYDGYLVDQIAYPNNLDEYYYYNERGQLTRVLQGTVPETPVASYEYELGAAGERLGVTLEDDSYIDWGYDQAYRLTSETMVDDQGLEFYQVDYAYDHAGNRVTEILNETDTTTYTYNDNDQLTHIDLPGAAIDIDYSYDLHGNLEQITQGTDITTFVYNGLERLESVTLPDTTTIDYTYDADGRRLSQTVNSTDTTTYLWDEFSTYSDVVQTSTAVGDTTYTTGLGLVLAQSTSTEDQYLYHDGQGSTRALADASGNIVDSYTYTAFGELYGYTGTPQTDFLYTGQQFDDLTGLYNLRARQYDPALGRFLSRDMAEILYNNPVELNRYVYTANNPINLSDPSGLMAMFEYSVLQRMAGGYTGAAVGMFTGGLTNWLIWKIAESGACGPRFKDWAQGIDPNEFIAQGAVTGAAFGAAVGAFPEISTAVGVTGAVLGGGASGIQAIRSFASGDFWGGMCSGLLTLLAAGGGVLAAKGGGGTIPFGGGGCNTTCGGPGVLALNPSLVLELAVVGNAAGAAVAGNVAMMSAGGPSQDGEESTDDSNRGTNPNNPKHKSDEEALRVANKTRERAQEGRVLDTGDTHYAEGHGWTEEQVREVLANPDAIYRSPTKNPNRTNIIFRKGKDIVVVYGPKAGSRKGHVLTAYGETGYLGDTGAAAWAQYGPDDSVGITHKMIINGQIPTPDGYNPPGWQIWP